MKNFIKLIVVLFEAGILGTSCKKGIHYSQPQTAISEQVAFSTPDKILAQVNNLYSKLQNASYYGGRLILFNEQRGEEFSQNDPNSSVGASIWGQNALSNDNL